MLKWVRHTLWQGSNFEDPFLARVQVCGPADADGLPLTQECRQGMLNLHLVFQPCFWLLSRFCLAGHSPSTRKLHSILQGQISLLPSLEGVLKKASLPSKCVAVVNLTPYDAHLERVCLKQLGVGLFAVLSMFVCRCGWALASLRVM